MAAMTDVYESELMNNTLVKAQPNCLWGNLFT